MASEFGNLYITYVDVDGDLLKIWGQKNRIGATYIERQLLQMLPDFNGMSGPDPSRVHNGMFCFAKYTDDNYYRARVISDVQGDSVGVLFVDYGNRDFIKISNIRIQQGNEDVLTKMSEQAEEYYLAWVMAPQFGWTKEVISGIRHDICYDEFRSRIVAHLGNQKVVEIEFRHEDFSNYLVKKQIARPLTLADQKQMIFSYCNLVSKSEALNEKINFSPSVPPPNLRSLKPHNSMAEPNAFHFNRSNRAVNFSKSPPIHYPPTKHIDPAFPQVNKNTPSNSFYSQGAPLTNPLAINSMPVANTAMNPLLNNNSVYQMKGDTTQFNNVIEILAQQVKQYIAQDNAKSETVEEKEPHHFVNSVLEVGSNYNVFVSHIDDGPWSFSIQLVSSEVELQKLMEELFSTKLVPLKPPIILGSPCIASSKLYGNLCRGVVVSISHSSVKVYFVDFGNAEDLPSSSIYELPTKFFKIQVMSQKFSLNGLERVTYSDDIKKFFKEVVQDELLMLRVTSLKGENLPTCELYVKDRNIKRILNEKIRENRNLNKEDFPKAGDTEDVVVTWIISPQKFFVQLRKRDLELNELKKELAEVEKKGQKIPSHQLVVGLRCISQYESDKQWYRAVITDIHSGNEINVFYIDYGNTERVNISSLRKIDGSCLINQLNPQAIQCSLQGFVNKTFDQNISNKLEELILEKDLKMTVVSSERELLCVQLIDSGSDVCSLLLAVNPLKNDMKITPSPMNGNEKDWPVDNQTNHSDMSQWDSRPLKNERHDSRHFQNDMKRGKNDDRKINEYKSKNSEFRSDNQQFKRRFEDKAGARGDKSFSTKFKSDKENQRNDQRFGRSGDFISEHGGNRGFRNDRGNWDKKKTDNPKDRKMSDGSRGGRRFDENRKNETDEMKKFEKRQNSWESSYGGDAFKKFGGGGGDRLKNSDQTRSTRKPIRRENIAPPGSRFEEKAIEIGVSERCIITYYFNPDDFYVQLLGQEEEFKKTMQDIQVYYSDKYSLRNPVQAGDIVVAMFSLDKILYRAEVIRATPVTVRYVDYGNREPVAPKGYWAVDKQFLKLPQQSVKCRLSNLQPMGSDWPPPGNDIDKFFEREEYKCTFTGYEDGVYEIILKAIGNDTDVASEIIAAGLGQPKSCAHIDLPKIDYNLLPNQVLKLYATHVISSSRFYVVLDQQRAGVVESNIKTYVDGQKVLAPLEKISLKPGTTCLTTFDDECWYRGIITNVNNDIVSVWFTDRGDDIEVSPEKVKSLPAHLAEIEPQAVECYLDGVTSIDCNNEEFRAAVEYRHHLVFIVSTTDNKLSVVLYNDGGEKSKFQEDTNHPKTIQPIGELPVLTQKLPLIVTHAVSLNQIYIQRLNDWDDLNDLTNQLSEFYAEEKEGFDSDEIGKLVAAKSIEYDVWYRGQVLSSSENGFEIFYIDYGSTEIVNRENIKKLDPSFLSFPYFARKISLDVEVSEVSVDEVTKKFLEITQEKELFGYFAKEGGQFLCELVLNEERISHILKNESVVLREADKFSFLSVKPVKAAQVVNKPSADEARVNDSDMKAFISHIDSPKQFWIHNESMIGDLQQLQDKLQKLSEELPEIEPLLVGDLVAAVFSGAWYRAKIVDVEDTNVTIQFIDYGNTIIVDTSEDTLKRLTPELRDVPVFATCCSLKGNWNANATSKFEEIILSSEDPVTVVPLNDGDPASVDLFQKGKSISEKLTEEGVACEENESESITVYITHSNSPNDFYIQRETSAELMCGISERLSEAESFKKPTEIVENETYVAKFPEDGIWYRAKVIEKYSDEYKVHFIDYGNSCNANEIRELPDDLRNVPDVAEHCSLLHGDTFDVWSEVACEKFFEYADGRECQMKVIESRAKKAIVTLICDGKNITEELGKLCEDDGRSEVYISHAISPTEFYLRYVHDEEYVTITKKLEEADEFEDLEDREPGTMCLARFADDGCWCRAKILKTQDHGCEILCMDFGKILVSNELKKLPPELKDIPPRALKCAFNLSKRNIPESVKEEFMSISLDSRSIFRARIVAAGEVNVVSLKVNGRIIEESLWNYYAPVDRDEIMNSIEGTDDNKKSMFRKEYLNVEDDARASGSIINETDEEKRVKIGITVGDEGFKCDDEKGSEALSGLVNATDNELIEVSHSGEEPEESVEEPVLETFEGTVNILENTEELPENKLTDDDEKTEAQNGTENYCKEQYVRSKSQKIVPGSISRGEEETPLNDLREISWKKLKHSEKVVPGSISRGVSLESVSNKDEGEEEPERIPRQVSQSAPSTPKLSRRQDANGYMKTSPNDRLVAGCISAGIPLEANQVLEKIPSAEKIVAGAVNGSVGDLKVSKNLTKRNF